MCSVNFKHACFLSTCEFHIFWNNFPDMFVLTEIYLSLTILLLHTCCTLFVPGHALSYLSSMVCYSLCLLPTCCIIYKYCREMLITPNVFTFQRGSGPCYYFDGNGFTILCDTSLRIQYRNLID